jgi:hypothetical protein
MMIGGPPAPKPLADPGSTRIWVTVAPGETQHIHASPRYRRVELERISLEGGHLAMRLKSLCVARCEHVMQEGPAWVLNHQRLGLTVLGCEPVTLQLRNSGEKPLRVGVLFHFVEPRRA